MRQDWIKLIRALSPEYGIDPQASLAVGSVEGLSGNPGDNNTSFGPFQLHVGGALPSGKDRAWAESEAGIRYALQQMSKVAKGKRGKAAVAAIVSGFERPADVPGEIRNASNALAQFRPGPTPGPAQATPTRAQPLPAREMDKNALIQSLFGGGVSKSGIGDFVKSFQTMGGNPARKKPDAPVETAAGASRPIHGKIIGTPHQGTHTLGNWESDNAVDVAMPVGTPIYAPVGGKIGPQFGSLGKSGRFEGIRMHLLTPQDELYLAHLSSVARGIHPGARVRAGQLLGYSGAANGVGHLHLGARNDDPQRYVS